MSLPILGYQRKYLSILNLVLLLLLLIFQTVFGELKAQQPPPIGPAFSYQNTTISMPDKWQAQPIIHEATITDSDIVVNLDQSQHEYLSPIIDEYAKQNGLKIHINSGTCGVSNRMLMHKQLNIGSFCCPPGAEDRLPGVQFHTLGISPLAFIVHPDNPTKNITYKQAQSIFMGDIRNWSEIDNVPPTFNKSIQPVSFIHCKKRPGHWRLFLENEELFTVRLKTVLTIPDMVHSIATDISSIGLESYWMAMNSTKVKEKVKTVKLNNIEPGDLKELAHGHYPLYRTYNLATWEGDSAQHIQSQKLVKYLINWVSLNGQNRGIVSSSKLREAGWIFKNNELIGESAMHPMLRH